MSIKEINGLSNFPIPGDPATLYVDTQTDREYRWSGGQYKRIPYGTFDNDGNINAHVNHRTNTIANLLALAGGNGELSMATDTKAVVAHNGVTGGAAFFLPDYAVADVTSYTPVDDGLGNKVYTVPLLARRMLLSKTAATTGGNPVVKLASGIYAGQKVTLLINPDLYIKSYPYIAKITDYDEYVDAALYGGMTITGTLSNPYASLAFQPYEREYVWSGSKWEHSTTPDKSRCVRTTSATTSTNLGAVLIPSACSFTARIKLQATLKSGAEASMAGEYVAHGFYPYPWGASNSASVTVTPVSALAVYGDSAAIPAIPDLTIGFKDASLVTADGRGVLQIKGTPSLAANTTYVTTAEINVVPL